MSNGPTKDQVAAVHDAIYTRQRLLDYKSHVKSIDVLLRLPRATDTKDIGPEFVVPRTGRQGDDVMEAISRANKLNTLFSHMADDVARLDIPGDDRRDLVTALRETGLAWGARANAWSQTGRAATRMTQHLDAIGTHLATAGHAAANVKAYLRTSVTQ